MITHVEINTFPEITQEIMDIVCNYYNCDVKLKKHLKNKRVWEVTTNNNDYSNFFWLGANFSNDLKYVSLNLHELKEN